MTCQLKMMNFPTTTGCLPGARALGVLDVFQNEVGIAAERMTAIGHGEFKPIVDNDTEENRALNRRVEIKVRHRQQVKNPRLGSSDSCFERQI